MTRPKGSPSFFCCSARLDPNDNFHGAFRLAPIPRSSHAAIGELLYKLSNPVLYDPDVFVHAPDRRLPLRRPLPARRPLLSLPNAQAPAESFHRLRLQTGIGQTQKDAGMPLRKPFRPDLRQN